MQPHTPHACSQAILKLRIPGSGTGVSKDAITAALPDETHARIIIALKAGVADGTLSQVKECFDVGGRGRGRRSHSRKRAGGLIGNDFDVKQLDDIVMKIADVGVLPHHAQQHIPTLDAMSSMHSRAPAGMPASSVLLTFST